MADITVRRASSGDAASVATLLTELGYPAPEDQIAERLVAGSREVLLAELRGESVGLIAIWVQPPFTQQRPTARITSMIVTASARRRGVGAALIQAAIDWARDHGCGGIELTSGIRPEREEAHRFYESHGFHRTSYWFWLPLDTVKQRRK